MDFVTPRDQFRGALLGSLLGPLYRLQHDGLLLESRSESVRAQLPERAKARSDGAALSLGSERLAPVAENWPSVAWKTLELAANTVEEALALDQLSCESSGTTGLIDKRNRQDLELLFLERLPATLVRSPWLSSQQSLAQYLCAALAPAVLSSNQQEFDSMGSPDSTSSFGSTSPFCLMGLWAEIGPYLQRFPQAEVLALQAWLNASVFGWSGESAARAQSTQEQIRRCLGGQLIAIHWGATQGA